MSELPKAYNQKDHEEKTYRLWEESGFFDPDNLPAPATPHAKPFTMSMAPPNVTGSLHMGHALEYTQSDVLMRWRRMQGYKTLWVPGTDHAGIATQNVVEKELKKEGEARHELGREKFIERVWKWKETYGNIILDQLKKLGTSCAWSRARFTMDEEYAKAVEAAFLHYYKKGWIYKGRRVVSWCTRCQTSLSDLELEHREEQSFLWRIRYPIAREEGYVIVTTTRPETMLGDEAVAVHPEDKRYKSLVGKKVILPLQNREIPIVADAAVDPLFGTGAVKVTPAHDIADFEIAERHKLPLRIVIHQNGRMTDAAGESYAGLKVADARKKVIEDLGTQGFLEKEDPYTHNLVLCYRCGTVIEPLPSEQWFLKMKELARMAMDAVKTGTVTFHPERWQKLYFDWLTGIKDWCISRQIWWGHRIPIWYCGGPEKASMPRMGFYEGIVPQVLGGKTRTYRLRDHFFKVGDRVVLENTQTRTVFGFAVITGVEQSVIRDIVLPDPVHGGGYTTTSELVAAFKKHYPPEKEIHENTMAIIYDYRFEPVSEKHAAEGCGQIIASTGRPAECPTCGGANLAQETDVLDTWFSSALWPFATLGWPEKTKDLETYYPTQVLTNDRGIINLWDARMIFSGLEFTGRAPFSDLVIHATVLTKEGKRMSKSLGTGIDPMRLIDTYGADATRFGLVWLSMGGQDIHFGEESAVAGKKFLNKIWNAARFVEIKAGIRFPAEFPASLREPENSALRDSVAALVQTTTERLEHYEFGQALHELYEFFWHTYCDTYIEWSKNRTDTETIEVLGAALVTFLKLLHPFIPFLTEALWQELRQEQWPKQLMIAEWPIINQK